MCSAGEKIVKEIAPVRRKVGLDKYLLYFMSKRSNLKPNYFKKQRFSSSFLLTSDNNIGPKWQWSTQQASFMS